QPVEVALLDRLPSELGVARDIGADVQAILLGLELLGLVHPAPLSGAQTEKGASHHRRGTLALAEPAVGLSPHRDRLSEGRAKRGGMGARAGNTGLAGMSRGAGAGRLMNG